MTPTEQRLAASVAALTVALRVALAAHPDRSRVIQELEFAAQGYADTNLNTSLDDKAIESGQAYLVALIQSLQPHDGTDRG